MLSHHACNLCLRLIFPHPMVLILHVACTIVVTVMSHYQFCQSWAYHLRETHTSLNSNIQDREKKSLLFFLPMFMITLTYILYCTFNSIQLNSPTLLIFSTAGFLFFFSPPPLYIFFLYMISRASLILKSLQGKEKTSENLHLPQRNISSKTF